MPAGGAVMLIAVLLFSETTVVGLLLVSHDAVLNAAPPLELITIAPEE